jgi:dUTPase
VAGPAPGPPTHLISSSLGEQPEAKPAPSLYRATPGSAGLDLCAPTDSILAPEDGVQILSTGVFWLPPPNTYFLILGRASTTLKGLTVHPSLVDNDYTGEIKILVSDCSGYSWLST